MRDPYSTLGLGRGASDEEIKRAYRRLAKRLHPDLNPGRRGAEQQFREASEAYTLLSDPVKRRRFDRGEIDGEGRERGFGGFGSGFAGARTAREHGFGDFSIDEVLQEFLQRGRRSGGRAQSGPQAGNQANAQAASTRTLKLTFGFIEAALGGKRAVTLADGRPVEVSIPA
ncbi:MAG: DnaJ domain-containing protein, partial [Stellaceae bacterium]